MQNPTRRRVLAAGFSGTVLGLISARTAAAGTTPPGEEGPASSPPLRPTADDLELLGFAQSFELTARDLYQAAIDNGPVDQTITVLRDNHNAYAGMLAGIIGTSAPGTPDQALFNEFVGDFERPEPGALEERALDLESTAVATHTELLRLLQGIEGAQAVAAILIVEARQSTVMADAAGLGDDLDALFVNDARPLELGGQG